MDIKSFLLGVYITGAIISGGFNFFMWVLGGGKQEQSFQIVVSAVGWPVYALYILKEILKFLTF